MKTVQYPDRFTRADLKIDAPEIRDRKIRALIKAMTMEEKFSLLAFIFLYIYFFENKR